MFAHGQFFGNPSTPASSDAGQIEAAGGTMAYDGSYRYHQFTDTSVTEKWYVHAVGTGTGAEVEYLVVAGGGAGGGDGQAAGGGGAGGVRTAAA